MRETCLQRSVCIIRAETLLIILHNSQFNSNKIVMVEFYCFSIYRKTSIHLTSLPANIFNIFSVFSIHVLCNRLHASDYHNNKKHDKAFELTI